MSLKVINPGLQTSVQGRARSGLRHFGVPASGPADALSLSLANKLVSAPADQAGLEITFGGAEFVFDRPMSFAITGAAVETKLSGQGVPSHKTLKANAGDRLTIGPVRAGCRVYLSVSGQIQADEFLGSRSTYLPGGFGGKDGRALKAGDRLHVSEVYQPSELETPRELRPYFNDNTVLQVCEGPDWSELNEARRTGIFENGFQISQRASRMGVELIPEFDFSPDEASSKASSPVFPGSIQLPPEGRPFVLLSDAQTTGGYPHILQVIRSDRFQLGQLKPGGQVRFVLRTAQDAAERMRIRYKAYSEWIDAPVI